MTTPREKCLKSFLKYSKIRHSFYVSGSNPVSCSQRYKRDIRWMSFFCMFKPLPGSNGSNVSAPLRSSQANVPGRSATSRALKEIEKESSDGWLFFCMFEPLPGSNGSNVGVPLRSSQQFQMLVKRRIAWYDKICLEMLAECISRNCRQHAIEFMHEGHTLKKKFKHES